MSDPVALVERFYEAMNTGDPQLIEDVAANVLSADWVTEPAPPVDGGFRGLVPWLRAAWPGFTSAHDEFVVSADGSRVAVRSTNRAVHGAAAFGLAPTGRDVEYRAFDFFAIEDGRITHTWHLEDFLGVAFQVGGVIR
ncbi:ester cyclase [Catenuloplanes japonicus]|uniref:ester cyclase n=1 Tax=Catenuloplanes japonicus TaxID=33876 RepID=UPI00068D4736|nr:ester cyclase [Catenuloplanes japonicus]